MDQTEELILEIERAYLPLPALAARLAAVEQSLQMFWTSLGIGLATSTPTPTPTPTFVACCATINPGPTIGFTDSIWGSGTLTYNPTSTYWECWLSGLSWPGSGGCGAATIAILYQFSVSPNPFGLTMWWTYDSTSFCPVNSTPTSSPGPGQTFQSITYNAPSGGTVFYCDTTPMTGYTYMSTSSPELALRQGHAAETIALTFAGSVATDGTSDFVGVCSCLPWTVTLNDSVYGNVTLTYNPILQAWVGCTTWTYAGTVNCAGGTIAIKYTLAGSPFGANWTMTVNWSGHLVSGHACPVTGATCASTLNYARGPIGVTGASISCSSLNTWTFGASANSPWPSTGAATLTITF
jgi:hypothetical protein